MMKVQKEKQRLEKQELLKKQQRLARKQELQVPGCLGHHSNNFK